MLPGKKYTPEDILQIAWRWKWLIIVPFVVVSIGTVVVSRLLPDKYRSSTLILVVPQRVPESYVRPTVTSRIEDRLQTISQQILSRTRLERVILDFNLYQRERKRGIMEDVVEAMRRDIKVDIVRGDAFSVSYVSEDPRMAMRVADRLATMFMDESRTDRAILAEATTDFLQNQLDEARRQLTEVEQKLADYKLRHAGELPSERDANLQALNNTQMQVQALVESINRDRDRRYLVEKQIADLESEVAQPPPVTPVPVDDPNAVPGSTTYAQLEYARAQLRGMELRLTAEHPDVRRMRRIVAELEKKLQDEALERPLSQGTAPERPLTQEERARRERLKNLRVELDALDLQLKAKQNEEQRLRGVINAYQAKLAATPARESELTALTRDYDTFSKNYQSLLAKQADSKVAANLERRQIGEQFKILDVARMPERPFSPNRPLINLLGALGGLGLGVGLAALMEYRDRSLRTDDEVVSVLALPVLAMVPVMTTAAERRKARRVRLRIALASAATLVVAAAVLAWKFDLWGYLTR